MGIIKYLMCLMPAVQFS